MKYFIVVGSFLILFAGCQVAEKTSNIQPNFHKSPEPHKNFSQIKVEEKTDNPDIDISEYTLITNNAEAQLADAKAVMQIKKNYPLAMKTKNKDLFERILARNFTFRGQNDFFNREDYINNRVQGKLADWSVKYENIALQFIGESALVTYRNVVKGNDENGKPDYTEYMTWADVYVKENGEWKIGAVHLVDYREETH